MHLRIKSGCTVQLHPNYSHIKGLKLFCDWPICSPPDGEEFKLKGQLEVEFIKFSHMPFREEIVADLKEISILS